jgi:hypothetical protein
VRPGPVVFRTAADGQPVVVQLRAVGDDAPVAAAQMLALLDHTTAS